MSGFAARAAFLVLFVGSLLSAQTASKPAAIEGAAIAGNVYSNPFFGITWEFPKDWSVGKVASAADDHVLIRFLPAGTVSPESIELNYTDPGFQSDEKSRQHMENKGWESLAGSNYYTIGGGIPARRYNYKSKATPVQYLTILSGPRRGYGLTVVFIAGSEERIQELIESALAMRIRPDWPLDAAPDSAVPQTAPVSRVRISQSVSQALLQQKAQPVYPPEARKARVEGSVLMLAHVGTDGKVEDLYVLSGHALLVPSAIEAVSRWKYQPYLLNQKPAEVETQITVSFTLH